MTAASEPTPQPPEPADSWPPPSWPSPPLNWGAPPPAPAARQSRHVRGVDIGTVIAGGFIGLSTLLPWGTVSRGNEWYDTSLFKASASGWDVVIVAAVVIALAAVAISGARSIVAGLAVVALGGYAAYLGCNMVQAARVRAIRPDVLSAGADVHVGPGAVVCALAGLGAFVTGVIVVCEPDPRRPRLSGPIRAGLLGGLMVLAGVVLPWMTSIDRDGNISYLEGGPNHQTALTVVGLVVLAATGYLACAERAPAKRRIVAERVFPVAAVVILVLTTRLMKMVLNDSEYVTLGGISDPGPGLFTFLAASGVLLLALMMPRGTAPKATDQA